MGSPLELDSEGWFKHAIRDVKDIHLEKLQDMGILFCFGGEGDWYHGVVDEPNNDPTVVDDDGEIANWMVYYEVDDSVAPHYLDLEYYSADSEPLLGCWCVMADATDV